MKDVMKLMAKGGIIGIANIIPGVSGGTMAVVLGIYERLIETISNMTTAKEKRKEYVFFLVQIGAGAGAAILILSWLMDFLLTYYAVYTYLFFIGLIIGSIPSIYKTQPDMKINISSIISFIAAVALIFFFSVFFSGIEKPINSNIEYHITLSAIAMLFIGGVFSGGSMIVPGISGSFILVLLGQYSIVIKAIKELNISLIFIIGIGVLMGIWAFAKIIDYLLKHNPKQTTYFILGLVIASLYPIYPGLPDSALSASCGVGLTVFATTLSYLLSEKG